MRRAIREHARDVVAIVALTVLGLVTMFVILSNQATALPSWFPILGKDRFELKAEFQTAQAVTPGQGQAVNISGIQVGDVTGVDLVDGNAVVTMEIETDKAGLINEDASLLLRPKTGLNDMVIEVDPGAETDEDIAEGTTIPLASTLPNVNPDEVLAALDADTQSFLKLLLAGAGEGLDGRGRTLSAVLRRFEPTARDIARINEGLALRRDNIRRSIHNFRLLSEELGDKDQDLTSFVDSSNAVLQRFANQEASIRGALRELPGALRETNGALRSADKLALATLPAVRDSLPGVRALAPSLRASRDLFRQATQPIRDQIRPFTRQVRAPVVNIRKAVKNLGVSTPGLKTGFTQLNTGLNALAYDPGSDESYLFHVPWLNHNLNNLYQVQDAHGGMRRGIVQISCSAADLAESTVFNTIASLTAIAQLTGVPGTAETC